MRISEQTEISWWSSSAFDAGDELVSAAYEFFTSRSASFFDIKSRSASRRLFYTNRYIALIKDEWQKKALFVCVWVWERESWYGTNWTDNDHVLIELLMINNWKSKALFGKICKTLYAFLNIEKHFSDVEAGLVTYQKKNGGWCPRGEGCPFTGGGSPPPTTSGIHPHKGQWGGTPRPCHPLHWWSIYSC